MCDVEKVWAEFNKFGLIDGWFPDSRAKAVIKDEVVGKLPVFLAAELDKPVTVLSILETWRAYVSHYRSAGIYAKFMVYMPMSDEDREKSIEDGRSYVEKSLEALDKTILAVKFMPMRTVNGTEQRATEALMSIRLRGSVLTGMTIRDAVERYPGYMLQMG